MKIYIFYHTYPHGEFY